MLCMTVNITMVRIGRSIHESRISTPHPNDTFQVGIKISIYSIETELLIPTENVSLGYAGEIHDSCVDIYITCRVDKFAQCDLSYMIVIWVYVINLNNESSLSMSINFSLQKKLPDIPPPFLAYHLTQSIHLCLIQCITKYCSSCPW